MQNEHNDIWEMNMRNILLKVEGLYKIFGKEPQSVLPLVKEGQSKDEILAKTEHTVGLNNIHLEIGKGEIFVIMGLSGSGKSTLIRHFNRLIEPTAGNILMEGSIDIMTLSPRELQKFRRQKMSMVFQRFGLMPHWNVLDNVAYGLTIQGVPKNARYAIAQQWLETVGLAGYQKQYPSQLSGGQQQRVGLARALCTDADVLLMDEAFSALDPLIRSEMQDQLIELQEKLRRTIVFITHDLDEALRLGDRIAILKDGALIQIGTPAEILLNPADEYVEAFVKDVNRARALTVETVMKPPANRISAETIGEALRQMKKAAHEYGYYVNADGYQGIVLQETLEQHCSSKESKRKVSSELLERIPIIAPDSILESVIPDTLDNEYPLPVVDGAGKLCGALSRRNLAQVLGDSSTGAEIIN